MLDLRVLRDRWNEAGAREIFGYLVTHCARSLHHDAVGVRANPGDEGMDTASGLGEKEQRVWQAKFFCDGVGTSQKAAIRDSFRSCFDSESLPHMVQWLLCIPIELDAKERRWWIGWRKREMRARGLDIQLWDLTHFQRFAANPDLTPLFDIALGRVPTISTFEEVRGLVRPINLRPLEPLPDSGLHENAVFVRKLKLAGATQNFGRRTLFYNWQLAEQAVLQGGSSREQAALHDLKTRILSVWEEEYDEHSKRGLGRGFVGHMDKVIAADAGRRLVSVLPVGPDHKKGALYGWADECHAGWTADFAAVLEDQ